MRLHLSVAAATALFAALPPATMQARGRAAFVTFFQNVSPQLFRSPAFADR